MSDRTTPRAWRVPVLIGLALFVGYLLLCVSHTLGRKEPTGLLAEQPGILWFGTWEMFTLRDGGNKAVTARAHIDGSFQDVDLEALFPTRWESGPRYQRTAWRVPYLGQMLAYSTCQRLPEARAVEISKVTWWKEIGRADLEPPPDAKTEVLLVWPCHETPELPLGRRL
ncbi:MAG: hypothetical protein GY913_16140 [Proteobacteria bacterium]|nr:hypothetical protein [Pseudomonadota bacterium]MCP4918436.1 hypothetical protein [Pseudomonadota bacterium]